MIGLVAPILAQSREQLVASLPRPSAPAGPSKEASPEPASPVARAAPDEDQAQADAQEPAPLKPIGPSLPPRPEGAAARESPREGLVDEASDEEGDASGAAQELPAQSRRVLGPSMPPPGYVPPTFDAEPVALDGPGDDDDEDDMIGPLPPEDVAEAEAATQDARAAEVERILKSLPTADAAHGGKEPAAANPYLVLGLEPAATSGQIRKAFMRQSLLIHPDKCDHPQAATAFHELSKAAKELQARSWELGCFGMKEIAFQRGPWSKIAFCGSIKVCL